jgi:hypothetical protein
MADMSKPPDEFCLAWSHRWLPDEWLWPLCMTKTEWSGWFQVLAGFAGAGAALAAALVALRAVRLAHDLQRQARADERKDQSEELAGQQIQRAQHLITESRRLIKHLEEGGSLKLSHLDQFRALMKPISEADYAQFPVASLVSPLLNMRQEFAKAYEALNHIATYSRNVLDPTNKGAQARLSAAAKATTAAEDMAEVVTQWLLDQQK